MHKYFNIVIVISTNDELAVKPLIIVTRTHTGWQERYFFWSGLEN